MMVEPIPTMSPPPSPTPLDTLTPAPAPTDTPTVSPSPTSTTTFTPTPAPTLEPQWVMQGPNEVILPILLYHHIDVHQNESPYYVSPDAFERQMNLLYEWGYRTISVEVLVRAIEWGAELPSRPIILTFDDGGEGTYTNALPIMQQYGFTGTAYVVYNYVGINGYLDVDQIRELHAAGWEIGSHSLSHVDLTKRPDRQMDEIVESRWKLQRLLDVPILSFAYPFGAYDRDSLYHVHFAGYIAAMGLGNDTAQGNENLFYLYRHDVKGSDDLGSFARLLPWREDMGNLPEVTPVP
jgi:peptidoglycan/xylan/chitin deacetylase (PgdA/CDA1 family)